MFFFYLAQTDIDYITIGVPQGYARRCCRVLLPAGMLQDRRGELPRLDGVCP